MKIIFPFLLLFGFISCTSKKDQTSLFDGKSLKGWRFFKNQPSDSWEVRDGELHCRSFDEAKQRADIITVQQFENFELALEFKISHQANSGVLFRVTEEFDYSFFTGPEFQLLDDVNYPGEVLETRLTASNFDMHAANKDEPVRPDTWNSIRLIVNKEHVEHWLNGKKVLEYELRSPDWNERRNNSKWKDVRGYGVPQKGHICLQDHGNEVWFRNITIKEL